MNYFSKLNFLASWRLGGSIDPRPPKAWLGERGILAVFIGAVAVRWIVSAIRELVPDEAYYWVWSRHLAMSYYDHPPMVALLIRFGTKVLGQTELGVRWPAAPLAMGAVLIMAMLARTMFDDAKPAAFVAVMLFVSPLVNVMGSVMTPDTPACFFQAAALAVAVRIFLKPPQEGAAGMWLLFGLLMGLALDSKYTCVLLGVCVLLAMISTEDGRRHLRTPWPWIAGVLAFALFSPVIIWNAQHGWASFLFQAHHGMGGDKKPWYENLGTYIGGQFFVGTPVLFVMIIVAIVIYLRRWNVLPTHLRLVLLSTLAPLLFFGFSSLRRVPEANWPVFAYFPGTLLVAQYLMENWIGRRVKWAILAAQVAFVGTVIIHLPEVAWAYSPKINVQSWNDMFGWRELADKVHEYAGYRPVFGQDYHLAAEMSFYLPGQPEVWQVVDKQADRSTQYDYFPNRLNPDNLGIVLVRKAPGEPRADHRDRQQFTVYPFNQSMQGHTIRKTWIERTEVDRHWAGPQTKP